MTKIMKIFTKVYKVRKIAKEEDLRKVGID